MDNNGTYPRLCLLPESRKDIAGSHLLKAIFDNSLVYRDGCNGKRGNRTYLPPDCIDVTAHREIAYRVSAKFLRDPGLLDLIADIYLPCRSTEIDVDLGTETPADSYQPVTALHDHRAAIGYLPAEGRGIHTFLLCNQPHLWGNYPCSCMLNQCFHRALVPEYPVSCGGSKDMDSDFYVRTGSSNSTDMDTTRIDQKHLS